MNQIRLVLLIGELGCETTRPCLWISKNVPQRLKPSSSRPFTAQLNPCPSSRVFPYPASFRIGSNHLLYCAVQIGQLISGNYDRITTVTLRAYRCGESQLDLERLLFWRLNDSCLMVDCPDAQNNESRGGSLTPRIAVLGAPPLLTTAS